MKAMMTKKQEDKVSEHIAIADVRHLCLQKKTRKFNGFGGPIEPDELKNVKPPAQIQEYMQ